MVSSGVSISHVEKLRSRNQGACARESKNFHDLTDHRLHSGELTWLAGKWSRIEDVCPIENGNIPASYVSLPEVNQSLW